LKLTENYFAAALIPALGAWSGTGGRVQARHWPETPAYYLLIPGASAEVLAELDLRWRAMWSFSPRRAFWNATAGAGVRARGIVVAGAFEGWPRVTPRLPSKRMFQLRTYESRRTASTCARWKCSLRRVRDLQGRGFHPVFFGDTLWVPHASLTYMLTFADTAELEAKWDVFRNDPRGRSCRPIRGSRSIRS